jgi:hypothetical protein
MSRQEERIAAALPSSVIRAFPPSENAMSAAISQIVSDEMLIEISKADYGSNWEQHLAELYAIRDSLSVPSPMAFYPAEVLRLVRWSSASSMHEHAMRAFCCATLLRAAATPANATFRTGENETLVQMIDSAVALQRGLPETTASFIAWRIGTPTVHSEERPFFAFGLLSLALLSSSCMVDMTQLEELAAFVEQVEMAVRAAGSSRARDVSGDSFLDITSHRLRHAVWKSLAARLRPLVLEGSRVDALARRVERKVQSR